MKLAVAEVMSPGVLVGSLEDEIEAVLLQVASRHFRHRPVVEDGVLPGLLTTGDLVMAQIQALRRQVETPETRQLDTAEEQP